MSFGQSSSAPPASAKQVDYLQSLVRKAGFADFREARHPLGLTQRQAAGKFSRREASELIDQLLGNEDDDSSPPDIAPAPVTDRRSERRRRTGGGAHCATFPTRCSRRNCCDGAGACRRPSGRPRSPTLRR
ncbi:MAG: hypothetical protein WKF58_14715 [Ilumatobacteraceae bacterium]